MERLDKFLQNIPQTSSLHHDREGAQPLVAELLAHSSFNESVLRGIEGVDRCDKGRCEGGGCDKTGKIAVIKQRLRKRTWVLSD